MIRWTERQWRLLAKFFIDQGLNPSAHGFRGAMNSAQKSVIEKEFQRPLHCLTSPDTKKKLKFHYDNLKREEASRTEEEMEEKKPSVPTLETATIEQLAAAMVGRLILELKETIVTALSQPKVSTDQASSNEHLCTNKHSPYPTSCEKQHKTRVLVVGPKNGVQKILQDGHPTLDLRFIDVEENPKLVFDRGMNCDQIILWLNMINHQHAHHGKRLNNGSPVHQVRGGVEKIYEVLNKIQLNPKHGVQK